MAQPLSEPIIRKLKTFLGLWTVNEANTKLATDAPVRSRACRSESAVSFEDAGTALLREWRLEGVPRGTAEECRDQNRGPKHH